MSERIKIAELRRANEALLEEWTDQAEPEGTIRDVLALLDAVEAAHEVAGTPFGQILARDFYKLRESLARFDFGEGK